MSAASDRCGELDPFTVRIGPARIDPEAIYLLVRPVEPLATVRSAIRGAIADVWGAENVPESAEGYRPHVSLGYSNSAGPAELIAEALAGRHERTAEITVTAVSLIDLNRDHRPTSGPMSPP